MPAKSIDSLRKHFQNIKKWIRSEKIHPSYAAEVLSTPKTRGAIRFSKSKKKTQVLTLLKKSETILTILI